MCNSTEFLCTVHCSSDNGSAKLFVSGFFFISFINRSFEYDRNNDKHIHMVSHLDVCTNTRDPIECVLSNYECREQQFTPTVY